MPAFSLDLSRLIRAAVARFAPLYIRPFLGFTFCPCSGIAGVVLWKYGVTPYHNRTDAAWVNTQDTTWTNIVAPLGKTLNYKKTAVPNCRPGAAAAYSGWIAALPALASHITPRLIGSHQVRCSSNTLPST